jgi:hypothetical protein
MAKAREMLAKERAKQMSKRKNNGTSQRANG